MSFKEYRRQQRIKVDAVRDKKNLENGVLDYHDFYMMRNESQVNEAAQVHELSPSHFVKIHEVEVK